MRADIRVTVEGGVAHVEVFKPGVVVEVRDYDVDGCDESRLSRDRDGELCHEYVMTHDDSCPVDEPAGGGHEP
jgi:hypothetical protein